MSETPRDRYYRLFQESYNSAHDADLSPTTRTMHAHLAELNYRLFKDAMVF